MAFLHRSPLAALLVAIACAPAGNTVGEADLDAIRANHAAFAAAVVAGNHDAVAALYAESAVVMPANEPMRRGRMSYRESLEAMPPVGSFTISGEEMTPLSGDAVLVTGQFNISLMIPGAEMAIADTGKFLEVWVREADGWKLGWDIWNSDLPLPTPAAATPDGN
ncbi:MAG: DUF4440 domain-containing protein [Gemmatimonadales bacterium]|nr:DUF4440 domain-containing protein [Gemmatimonadales bacterium]